MTIVYLFGALSLALAVYWFPVRRTFSRWGATSVDLARRMPGDAMVREPTFVATLAITVDAPPRDIWPWLMQMGYARGGLYSYDWLDRVFGFLDRPSAARVLPAFQHLEVGDVIPIGRGPGFPVAAIDARRSLVLGGTVSAGTWIWQFGLYPVDTMRTRLVSRNSARMPRTLASWLLLRLLEPAAFLMTRRMLIGIGQRAASLAEARRSRLRHAA